MLSYKPTLFPPFIYHDCEGINVHGNEKVISACEDKHILAEGS